jgi:hypothetical protein
MEKMERIDRAFGLGMIVGGILAWLIFWMAASRAFCSV